MAPVLRTPVTAEPLPDHTQLPDSDGKPVENFQEHPQSVLLTDSILPVLRARHPDGQFAIGSNSGIYWRSIDPSEAGCKAPDWFYVPGVPPLLEGQLRRSYVMWKEIISPLLLLEFASGDGNEERDRTPWEGKFWVYEHAIRPGYYGIFEPTSGRLEMHRLIAGEFVRMEPNEHGRFEIQPLGVELGVWRGWFLNAELAWLRFWDRNGNLLLTGDERAEAEQQRARTERQRAETERQRADAERQRADRLAAKLRELGVEPE